jgi:enamine deaminase RidA (YjgF/YER057c/UK114 family)
MSDIAYTPILPEGWSRPRGFSHAVVATGTRSVRIAGQIGREPSQAQIPPDADAGTQWRIALSNLVTVLKAAGGQPQHLVALRAYVTDIAEFNASGAAVGAAWGATLGRHFPAMTLVQVSALIDPNAKVEIEGEAILP